MHWTNARTGSRVAKTGVAGSRRWGRRRRKRRPGPPPSRTHDGKGDGTGGPGRHLCAGHAPAGSRPLARMPLGGRGHQGGGLFAAPSFRVSTRGCTRRPGVSFRFAAPAPVTRSIPDAPWPLLIAPTSALRHLHGAARLPFPVTSLRQADGEKPLNFLQGRKTSNPRRPLQPRK